MAGDAGSVGDGAVQKAVGAAVGELGSKLSMITSSFKYAASRGEAELAWRTLQLFQCLELKMSMRGAFRTPQLCPPR